MNGIILRKENLVLLFAVVGVLVEVPPANAETVMYQQGVDGYACTSDTWLASCNPEIFCPEVNPLACDDRVGIDCCDTNPNCDMPPGTSCPDHGLLRFGCIFGGGTNQIPLGSTIESATLTLNIPLKGGEVDTCIPRMLQEWSEHDTWTDWGWGIQADGIEAAEEADDPCWDSVDAGTLIVNVTASLQAWSDGALNYGWAFLPDPDSTENDGWAFSSSEEVDPALRPKLEVTYAAPPSCRADLNGDGKVDAFDLAILLGSWGQCVTNPNLVFNGEFIPEKLCAGWKPIDHSAANCQDTPGWNGKPGWFLVNGAPNQIPVGTNQLITGLTAGQTYIVSGYFSRRHDNGTDPNFQVLVDDDVFFQAGGNVEDGWTFFSFEYGADGPDALLRFQAQLITDDDYGIDNIQFIALP